MSGKVWGESLKLVISIVKMLLVYKNMIRNEHGSATLLFIAIDNLWYMEVPKRKF